MSGRRGAAVVAAALALLAAGCGSGPQGAPVAGLVTGDNHGYQGSYLTAPYPIPDIALEDTGGEPFSLAESAAPVKVVFFGYTQCPDICQIMMSTISSALARLEPEQRRQVQVVFVTTDPARDTGAVLREYLDRFGEGYVGLTGELPRIIELGDPMKVFIDKGRKLPSGGYEVDHTTYVFGVTGAEVRVIWTQGSSPAAMAEDIVRLLDS